MEKQLWSISDKVPTVNYHLWQPCNMRCGFCFATFLDISPQSSNYLAKVDALQVVDLVSLAGFTKINFAGGEPTLCPWLVDLIGCAKTSGLTASVVTNGSKITDPWLDSVAGFLDIIAVSIDSVDAGTLLKIGRTVKGKEPISEDYYRRICESVKDRRIRLKVNTVVNQYNLDEDFRPFIKDVLPERWKIFQALLVQGQNEGHFDEFAVTLAEFNQYVARNRSVESDGICVVPETNELMTGSYLMIDPLGRFFDDTKGKHTYSRPILEVGVERALEDIDIYPECFAARGGFYE